MGSMVYAGFWIRVAASLIDTLLMMMVVLPVMSLIYGPEYWFAHSYIVGFWDFLFNYLLPAIVVIVFWLYKSATPGKMALKLTIVDASTGEKPSTKQLIIRYVGYYVSIIPLMLGFIWVGIDKRKQGFHDKLAGTVVLRNTAHEPVVFERSL